MKYRDIRLCAIQQKAYALSISLKGAKECTATTQRTGRNEPKI
jgi:hypothetical protein